MNDVMRNRADGDLRGLRALCLSLCLVHCGSGKTTSEGAGSDTTGSASSAVDTTSGTGSPTSGMVAPDFGETGNEPGCIVEVWNWVHDQSGWNASDSGLALAGSRIQAVGGVKGASFTLAVTGDGSFAWGPKPLAGADPQAWFGSGIVGMVSGDAFTLTSGVGSALLERWSVTGDSGGVIAIPGDGYRLGPTALTPSGGIVAGGYVGASLEEGEAVLMSLSTEGVPDWDIHLAHNFVSAVAVDPTGTIFVLAVDREIEGGVVFLEVLDPNGLGKWAVEAGSNVGFAGMGALTPFAMTPDGVGGVYTLGQEHTLQMGNTPKADAMLLARYQATGELAWEVRPEMPDVIEGGGLAVSGDVFSAVRSAKGTSLVVHDLAGVLVCEHTVPDRWVNAVASTSNGEVILTGRATPDEFAWFAKYRVVPG